MKAQTVHILLWLNAGTSAAELHPFLRICVAFFLLILATRHLHFLCKYLVKLSKSFILYVYDLNYRC